MRSVAFSPDGRLLASASADGTIRLWDAASGQRVSALEGHTDIVAGLSISPDGRLLASGSNERLLASGSNDTTVRLWDVASGQLVRTLEGHTWWVMSVAFAPDGRLLAFGSEDKTVRLWDAQTGALQIGRAHV